MTQCLQLVDRLRGIYILPVNDGAGPLDGKMTFDRKYNSHPSQVIAAAALEQLENGAPHTNVGIQVIIDDLLTPRDWLGLGLDPYVAPICLEAVEELKKFIS